ncbi:hypothetical protein GQF56_22015 [Rhodobacter sphaeroides]|nr:hypothetical protein [Cereibacter sphaeroides]
MREVPRRLGPGWDRRVRPAGRPGHPPDHHDGTRPPPAGPRPARRARTTGAARCRKRD